MDPQAQLAAAQVLLGITLLAFVPIVVLTLLVPRRDASTPTRRR